MVLRLQKYLAEAGIASRRASEELITSGRVQVNGAIATLGMSVDPETDIVLFDGKPVKQEEELITVMLYKPKGVVSTSDDPQGRKTVQEYVKDIPVRLYNVGRLDINSQGLLLMTNHGELENLCIAGRPVGQAARALIESGWCSPASSIQPPREDKGSVILIAATDLPMSAAQLKRVARRAVAGLSRTGNAIGHGSGEIALCFSTANRIRHFDKADFRTVQELNERHIGLPFHAIAEAAEEAVLSSMFRARAVEGRDGHRAESLAEVWKALGER